MIVAALLILGTIAYLLSGGSFLSAKTTLYLYLNDATGVAADSPVRVDGIGVGKVVLVELSGLNDAQRVIRVTMKVDRARLESITSDSTAQTTSDTLVGDKFVDITSGVGAQHLPPGGEIQFKGATEMMKSIDIEQFQKQIKVIETLLDDIEHGRSPLGQFVLGDEIYNQLRDKISSLQGSIHAAAATTGAVGEALYTDSLYRQIVQPLRDLDQSLAQLQSGQGSAGLLLRDNRQYEQARAQVADLRRSIEDAHSGEMLRSDRMYKEWTRQVTGITQAVNVFNAGPLLTTSAVYDNLNGMAKELQETMKEFRENPRKFLRIEIF